MKLTQIKPTIEIEVVSDVVCPWCYIGKRRLEKAVDQLKDKYDVKVRFSPFELNPDMPVEGADQKKYLISKFGNPERYEQLIGNVTNVARSEGLNFDYESQKVSPNTRESHRVIFYAQSEGKQNAVKEAFMKAYFEKGVDLSKQENILNVGVSAGLDRGKLEQFLNSDEGKAEVEQSEELSRERGVSGVPFYIINNKYGVSGAQPSETFVQILTEVGNEVSVQGESCSVDDANC